MTATEVERGERRVKKDKGKREKTGNGKLERIWH